ncbi:hypothetical protein XENTR_v10025002 [Xenopus tropicalis]|nr:hypothetical protein XENTR_v10025002 [Xenopus tropicalis]
MALRFYPPAEISAIMSGTLGSLVLPGPQRQHCHCPVGQPVQKGKVQLWENVIFIGMCPHIHTLTYYCILPTHTCCQPIYTYPGIYCMLPHWEQNIHTVYIYISLPLCHCGNVCRGTWGWKGCTPKPTVHLSIRYGGAGLHYIHDSAPNPTALNQNTKSCDIKAPDSLLLNDIVEISKCQSGLGSGTREIYCTEFSHFFTKSNSDGFSTSLNCRSHFDRLEKGAVLFYARGLVPL